MEWKRRYNTKTGKRIMYWILLIDGYEVASVGCRYHFNGAGPVPRVTIDQNSYNWETLWRRNDRQAEIPLGIFGIPLEVASGFKSLQEAKNACDKFVREYYQGKEK